MHALVVETEAPGGVFRAHRRQDEVAVAPGPRRCVQPARRGAQPPGRAIERHPRLLVVMPPVVVEAAECVPGAGLGQAFVEAAQQAGVAFARPARRLVGVAAEQVEQMHLAIDETLQV